MVEIGDNIRIEDVKVRVEDVKVRVEEVKMEKVRVEDVKVNEVTSDNMVPDWLWGGESVIC